MGDAMRYLGVLKKPGGPGRRWRSRRGRRWRWPARRPRPTTACRSPRASCGSTSKRRTKVRLSCGPTVGKQCKGTVSLTRGKSTLMGRRSFTITANKTRNVTVRISKSAYKRWARQDDWTTLPDENGHTSARATGRAAAPTAGQRLGRPAPVPRALLDTDVRADGGTARRVERGERQLRRLPGWDVDLSPFAGSQVEVSITYATDPFVQGLGIFVDDTEGAARRRSSSSTRLRERQRRRGPPRGRPRERRPTTQLDPRTQPSPRAAAVATATRSSLGFGLEGVSGAATRRSS